MIRLNIGLSWKVAKNMYHPRYGFTPKTGMAVPKTGVRFYCVPKISNVLAVKTIIYVLRMKVKQSVNRLLSKIPIWTTISMGSSRRDLFINMVVGRLSPKITKLRSPPISPLYPKKVWNYLKQGLAFPLRKRLEIKTWTCWFDTVAIRAYWDKNLSHLFSDSFFLART